MLLEHDVLGAYFLWLVSGERKQPFLWLVGAKNIIL
jgi:hypothetical protein